MAYVLLSISCHVIDMWLSCDSVSQLDLTLILAADKLITEETPDITVKFEVSSADPENDTDLADNTDQHTFSFDGLADVFLQQPWVTSQRIVCRYSDNVLMWLYTGS